MGHCQNVLNAMITPTSATTKMDFVLKKDSRFLFYIWSRINDKEGVMDQKVSLARLSLGGWYHFKLPGVLKVRVILIRDLLNNND